MARSTGGRKRTHLIEQGDIYDVSLDPTRGGEQQGSCSVLVVSPAAFNEMTGVPIVAPITSGGGLREQPVLLSLSPELACRRLAWSDAISFVRSIFEQEMRENARKRPANHD